MSIRGAFFFIVVVLDFVGLVRSLAGAASSSSSDDDEIPNCSVLFLCLEVRASLMDDIMVFATFFGTRVSFLGFRTVFFAQDRPSSVRLVKRIPSSSPRLLMSTKRSPIVLKSMVVAVVRDKEREEDKSSICTAFFGPSRTCEHRRANKAEDEFLVCSAWSSKT